MARKSLPWFATTRSPTSARPRHNNCNTSLFSTKPRLAPCEDPQAILSSNTLRRYRSPSPTPTMVIFTQVYYRYMAKKLKQPDLGFKVRPSANFLSKLGSLFCCCSDDSSASSLNTTILDSSSYTLFTYFRTPSRSPTPSMSTSEDGGDGQLTPSSDGMEYFAPVTQQVARQEQPTSGRRIVMPPRTPSLSPSSDRTPLEEIPDLDLAA
jgi:hypothetical protein